MILIIKGRKTYKNVEGIVFLGTNEASWEARYGEKYQWPRRHEAIIWCGLEFLDIVRFPFAQNRGDILPVTCKRCDKPQDLPRNVLQVRRRLWITSV